MYRHVGMLGKCWNPCFWMAPLLNWFNSLCCVMEHIACIRCRLWTDNWRAGL